MAAASPILHAGPLILRSLHPVDAPALCHLAADKRIAATTISVPHPYTRAHADSFIQHAQQEDAERGSTIFAVTILTHGGATAHCFQGEDISLPEQGHEHLNSKEILDSSQYELVGTVSLMRSPGSNEAELGYWIGVPYWGRGFAQLAAKAAVQYAFGALKLARVCANCFASNRASSRVLAKVGMHRMNVLEKSHEKWGMLQDEEVWLADSSDFAATLHFEGSGRTAYCSGGRAE